MKEWNVYVNGRYVGTVNETTEDAARAAAFSKAKSKRGARA